MLADESAEQEAAHDAWTLTEAVLEDWFAERRRAAEVAIRGAAPLDPPRPRPAVEATDTLNVHAWNPEDFAPALGDLDARGCVLLRDFLPAETAQWLAGVARDTYCAVDHNLSLIGAGLAPEASIYHRPRDLEPTARPYNDLYLRSFGGMLVESVPYAGYLLFDILNGSGILPLVAAYIGGPPLVSGVKCTLRVGDPAATVPHVFHQDGSFLGGETARSLNLWIALTEAGIDAPGLEILPDRLENLLPNGVDAAALPWEVDTETVYRTLGRERMATPAFKPGDAILFDHMCLHRTHSLPEMPNQRLAYECWFFPPESRYQGLRLMAP